MLSRVVGAPKADMLSSAEAVFDSLAFMPVSSDFVRELFTASSQIHSIFRFEGQRLIERAAR